MSSLENSSEEKLKKGGEIGMKRLCKPDPAASSLAKRRWSKVSADARSQHGRKLASARWERKRALAETLLQDMLSIEEREGGAQQ